VEKLKKFSLKGGNPGKGKQLCRRKRREPSANTKGKRPRGSTQKGGTGRGGYSKKNRQWALNLGWGVRRIEFTLWFGGGGVGSYIAADGPKYGRREGGGREGKGGGYLVAVRHRLQVLSFWGRKGKGVGRK